MEKKSIIQKSLLFLLLMGMATMSYAQRYTVNQGRVYFGNEHIRNADPRTFVDLGNGYAKDINNVYKAGRILEYVDPSTFRLKEPHAGRRQDNYEQGYHPYEGGYQPYEDNWAPGAHRGYFKTTWNVYYGDKKLDAMPSTFQDLGGGYAKDSFNVFYYGEKIKGANGSTFTILGGGYSKDSFNVYYLGDKIQGAYASTFKVLGNGYAEDSFNSYYRGRKLK